MSCIAVVYDLLDNNMLLLASLGKLIYFCLQRRAYQIPCCGKSCFSAWFESVLIVF